MARCEYWTHGVETVVEFPKYAIEIRHAGWGTRIRQLPDTTNWLHLALPSANAMDGERVFIREARLRAKVNENCRIDTIHLRMDGGRPILSRTVSLTDRTIDEEFQIPDTRFSGGGLVVSIHVQFLTGEPLGEIVLQSGGVTLLN